MIVAGTPSLREDVPNSDDSNASSNTRTPQRLAPFCLPFSVSRRTHITGGPALLLVDTMATPFIFGVGAIAAALTGRHLVKRGLLGGKGAAEQWVKGGFKAKMDRSEAVEILGLKCVLR